MKKGLLFTITTFVLFLAVFVIATYNVQQKNQDIGFANTLSAANNVFYTFDSIESNVRDIEQAYGPIMSVTYGTNISNFTLKESLPANYQNDITRFQNFVKQMSALNITITSNSTKYVVMPYNLTVDDTNSSITNTFINNSNSSGKLKSIRIDIWTNSSVNITSQNATNSSGINLFIYVHTNNGSERTYNNTLDLNKQSNISIKFGSKTSNITFGPVGLLKVVLYNNLSFNYSQYIILSDYGKVNINYLSNIIVNNTDYGVFKNSSVSVIK